MIEKKAVAGEWISRGFSCDEWVDVPGQRWEDFVHDTDELVMVLTGSVEFEFGGTRYRPSVGEELLIPANARHSVRNVGTTTARWLFGYRRR